MEWFRVESIGNGSSATVYKAIPRNDVASQLLPPLLAVKSTEACFCDSLKNEKQILDSIGTCRHIIRCFGDQETLENNGQKFYNLLFEFASEGDLADQVINHGGGLPEPDIKRYTRAILKGLSVVHAKGFVHCDIKPENILVFDNGVAKIADFGLAKETGQPIKMDKTLPCCGLRGTPLFMAPESVKANEYEQPCDIWALGCVVVEMLTGKPAWNHKPDTSIFELLKRIVGEEEFPAIPEELSDEGKDFLSKCFVKDPRKRWTAEMLLNHAFIADHVDSKTVDHETVLLDEDEANYKLLKSSPRSPFDFLSFLTNFVLKITDD